MQGCCDDGSELDGETWRRFFSLPATEGASASSMSADMTRLLKTQLERQKQGIINGIGTKNATYFEVELDKLDKWGEDRRNSLRQTLKELDDRVKELKKLARLAPNLPEKLQHEKERRQLEGKRDEAWREYDGAARDIEKKKDQLIDEIEKKLRQEVTEQELFTIRWRMM